MLERWRYRWRRVGMVGEVEIMCHHHTQGPRGPLYDSFECDDGRRPKLLITCVKCVALTVKQGPWGLPR